MIRNIKQFSGHYFSAIIAFLFFLGLTLLVYFKLKESSRRQNEKQFKDRISQANDLIIRRVDNYVQVLKGGKALFLSSGQVSRQEWKNFISALEVQQDYPGIQGIGFAQVIKPQELQQHIAQIRRSGLPEYTVKPAGPRPLYTPIIYIEPFSGANLRAFGYDMFSEQVRRNAMEKARNSGNPTLSGKVQLIQDIGRDIQAGFLLYLPLYRYNILPTTQTERQQLLTGYIYSPFRATDLMHQLFNQRYNLINIQIYDGEKINPEALLYDKNANDPKLAHKEFSSLFQEVRQLQLPGRTWTIRYTDMAEFGKAESLLPNLILAGGSIISFLVFVAMILLGDTRRLNQLRQTITDNATAALFVMDAKGYCTFMNPAAEEMTGYTFEEIRKQPLHNMIHHTRPDGSPYPLVECPIDRALPTNNSMRAHEDVFIRKDGTFFRVSCAANPIFENGVPISTVIEVRDITEERKAQIAIQESEVRFRNMADSAPVLIWTSDAAGQLVYLNRQWLQLTGQSLEEALRQGWLNSIHPEDLPKLKAMYADAHKRQLAYTLDYRMRRYDGEYRWMASSATPRFDMEGQFLGCIGSIIDITDRKEAEKRLKESADLLQEIFLEVPAIVSLIRASDQKYMLTNPMFTKLLGDRPLLGRSIWEANPDLEKQGFFEQINKVIETGEPFVGQEVPVSFENNGNIRKGYFNMVFQPLNTTEDQVTMVLLFAVEVTELVKSRKKLLKINEELNRTNAELRRTNTDLDNFVYTASHDLKAPIANLEGLTNDLQHSLQNRIEGDELYMLQLLSISINKLKRTVLDLAEITKVQKETPEQPEPLVFAEILADVTADLQTMIKESKAHINVRLEIPQVNYARKDLRSILYNLLSNAIKYRSPERTPEITITTTEVGNYIRLSVQDNGLGIREDQQHKLFSMFKRVHTHVEGSGIGLYILKRIVENNGGRIELESKAGEGSTFYVYFLKQQTS